MDNPQPSDANLHEESPSPIAQTHGEKSPDKKLADFRRTALILSLGALALVFSCWFSSSLFDGDGNFFGFWQFVYGCIALAVVAVLIGCLATGWHLVRYRRRLTAGRLAEILFVVSFPIIVLLWLTVALTGLPNNVTELRLQRLIGRRDLASVNLSGAYIVGADLSRVDLSGANLSGADLSGADLVGADLSGANLNRAYLSAAHLSGADLSRASLKDALVDIADLSKANLSGADLSGTDLAWTNLSGADLTGANLSNTRINYKTNFTGAIMPDGTVHE